MLYDIIINTITSYVIFTSPLVEKIKISRRILIFLVCLINMTLLLGFPQLTFMNYLYIFIVMSLCGLIVALDTKDKLLNIIAMVFGYIISVVINNVLLFLMDIIFNFEIAKIVASFYVSVVFHLFNLLCIFLASKLLKKLILRFMKDLSQPVLLFVFIELILCFFVIMVNIVYGRTIGFPPATIYFNCSLFAIFFVASSFMVYMIVTVSKKNALLEQENVHQEDLKIYISDIEKANEAYRVFKHDYMNILATMDVMIHEKNSDELIDYFDNNILKTRTYLEAYSNDYHDLSNIKALPLKSIIISKIDIAVLKNIKISVAVDSETDISKAIVFDTSQIIGIFLDNAIEAAEISETPFIAITVTNDSECTQIIIENSMPDEPIDFSQLGTKGYSTKGKHRGLGLFTVKRITEHNSSIVVDTKINENRFIQYLIAYKED